MLLDYEAVLFDSKALSTFSFDSSSGCFFLSDASGGSGAGFEEESSQGPGQGKSSGSGPGPGQGRRRRPCPFAIHHAGKKEQLPQFRDQLRTWRFGNDRKARDAFFDTASVYVDGIATPFKSLCSPGDQ
jgi:hypothetical protein